MAVHHLAHPLVRHKLGLMRKKSVSAKDFRNLASEGIERLTAEHPDVDLYVAAIDECLDDQGYILPGLGDAGDKIFGTK